jgi:hypothetical protein
MFTARAISWLLTAFAALPLLAQQREPRLHAELFAGLISRTPFIGGDAERHLSGPLSAIGEIIIERDQGTQSYEARVGGRYLLARGLPLGAGRAVLYGKADGGAITCSESNSLCAIGEVAAGVVAQGGMFEGSFVEVGYGQTDLGFRKERSAPVMDVYVTYPLRRLSPFVGVSGQRRSFDLYAGLSLSLR